MNSNKIYLIIYKFQFFGRHCDNYDDFIKINFIKNPDYLLLFLSILFQRSAKKVVAIGLFYVSDRLRKISSVVSICMIHYTYNDFDIISIIYIHELNKI